MKGRWVLVWLLVVAAGASVSWLAIGLAGQEVTTLARPRPTLTEPTAGASGIPGAAPPTAPSTAPPASATSDPAPPVVPAPTAAVTRPSTPAPPAAPAPPKPAAPVSAALVVEGGTVWASCTGGQPRIDTVTPSSGWSVAEQEAAEAKVTFVDSRTGADVEVEVHCVDGRPVNGHS